MIDADDPTPPTFEALLALLQDRAAGRWGIWRMILDDRPVYFGRRLFWPNKERMDPRARLPHERTACCLRCGGGRTFRWAASEPTAYVPLRWVSLCLNCLGFYIGLWPEIFPRFRLGVRTQQGQDRRWDPERFGQKPIFKIDHLDWCKQPPFTTHDRSAWAQSSGRTVRVVR